MPPSASRRPSILFLIDPLAQFLARLEVRHEFLRDVNPLARFRIAADARRPTIQPETPEAADLDALPLHQALRHRVEDHLDGEFGILGDELRITRRQPRNKFGLGHAGPRIPPRLLLRVLVVQFRLQERAQVGASRAGGAFALELGHCLVLLGGFLLLDRKIDGPVLAVDVDDHCFDAVAFLEMSAGVLDAVAGDLRGAQVTLEVAAQSDNRPLGVDRLDGARDQLALFVARYEVVERIAFELLDPERNPLALDVDRQHLRLGLLALLVVAHRLFAGQRPGQVRQVHQAVDPALQPDENAEVGDRLDLALHLVALLEIHRELFPGIGKALLHPEGDAAPLLVDLEDHDLDLVAERDHLRRMHVLVGPVHLRHVHQAFDALLHFDEGAVVGEIRDLAEEARSGRIAAREAHPGILAQLLQAEGNTVLLGVEFQHLGRDFVADREHFGRVLHAPPGEIGDVEETVDAAEIDERAVIGDVLDDALDRRPLLQVREQRLALRALRGFEHGAAGHDHVVPLAVELDDLELHLLALVGQGVLDGTDVDERAGEESSNSVGHDGEAALHFAGNHSLDEGAGFERLFQIEPRGEALGLVARQARFAVTVLERFDRDAGEIAGLDFDFALVVLELFQGDKGFGLQTGVDDDVVDVDPDDFGGDHLAGAHLLAREAFLKESGEAFRRSHCGDCIRHRHLASARHRGRGSLIHDKKAKSLRYLASCHLFPLRYQSTIRAAACSAVIDVVSSGRASGLCLRGAALRVASRASRSRKSCKRAASVAAIPFSFNCLCRRSARASGLAVRNTLSSASGKTTEPMSRPSATSPGGRRNARWRSSRAWRTRGCAATTEAAAEHSSVRMASVTLRSPRKISFPSKRAGNRRATVAAASSSRRSMPSCAAASATSRYRAALWSRGKPSGPATRCATVPLPDADGPSMAMTGTALTPEPAKSRRAGRSIPGRSCGRTPDR